MNDDEIVVGLSHLEQVVYTLRDLFTDVRIPADVRIKLMEQAGELEQYLV